MLANISTIYAMDIKCFFLICKQYSITISMCFEILLSQEINIAQLLEIIETFCDSRIFVEFSNYKSI